MGQARLRYDVRDPRWYFDADGPVWAGSAELSLAHMTRLFNDPIGPLAEFDDAQLNQGFWYLVGSAGSNHMLALTDASVDLPARVRGIESFYSLFAKLFALRCSPHLSYRDEPGCSPLNSACYMFWDINPFCGAPAEPSHRELDAAALRVMDETLALDSLACKESALHGLGHWRRAYPKPVDEILDRALRRQTGWPPALLTYAGYAKAGYVL